MKISGVVSGALSSLFGGITGAATGAVKGLWGGMVAGAGVVKALFENNIFLGFGALVGYACGGFLLCAGAGAIGGAVIGGVQGIIEGAERGYKDCRGWRDVLSCPIEYAINRGAQNLNFEDNEPGLLSWVKAERAPAVSPEQPVRKSEARREDEPREEAEAEARRKAEALAQRERDARRQAEAQREEEARAQRQAEAQARREAEAQARREAEAQARSSEPRRDPPPQSPPLSSLSESQPRTVTEPRVEVQSEKQKEVKADFVNNDKFKEDPWYKNKAPQEEGGKLSLPFKDKKDVVDFFAGQAIKGREMLIIDTKTQEVMGYTKGGKMYHADGTQFKADDKFAPSGVKKEDYHLPAAPKQSTTSSLESMPDSHDINRDRDSERSATMS